MLKIAVRLRPDAVDDPLQTVSRFLRPAVSATSSTGVVVEPSSASSARDGRHAFTFDRVFGTTASQSSIYTESVSPLVQRFLDGFNTTIFAYGQTSSGKSYSMGTSEESEMLPLDDAMVDLGERIGIIPRAARHIFESLQGASDADEERTLTVSFLELYNEDLIDLLSDPIDEPHQVQIRETRAGDIVWMGLRQHSVTSAHDVVALLQDGMRMRQTHETEMNAQSSRSHAIFSMTLTRKRRAHPERAPSSLGRASPERAAATPRTMRSGLPTLMSRTPVHRQGSPTRPQTPTRTPARVGTPARRPGADDAWITTTSKLHFVDLAGSERLKRTAATGERAREGIAINSGLHALGNVISVLSDPARGKRTLHVPYRDSKLTRLLQDSLGGNAHTLMIACVSSTDGNVSETLNTLQYAQRARRIRNTVERNQAEVGWDNVEYLQAQVLRLRKELELVRSSNELVLATPTRTQTTMPSELERELLSWQEKCSALSRKNVQLSAELVQREQERGGSANDFLEAAEPVIVEYEKTVDALEGQINMLKAAAAYSDQLLQERDHELEATARRADKAEARVQELLARLGDNSARTAGELADTAATPTMLGPHRRSLSPDANVTKRPFRGARAQADA